MKQSVKTSPTLRQKTGTCQILGEMEGVKTHNRDSAANTRTAIKGAMDKIISLAVVIVVHTNNKTAAAHPLNVVSS